MKIGYATATSIELNLRQVFLDTLDQSNPKGVIEVNYLDARGYDERSKGIPYTIKNEELTVRPSVEPDGVMLQKKIFEKHIPLTTIQSFRRFELADVLADTSMKPQPPLVRVA